MRPEPADQFVASALPDITPSFVVLRKHLPASEAPPSVMVVAPANAWSVNAFTGRDTIRAVLGVPPTVPVAFAFTKTVLLIHLHLA